MTVFVGKSAQQSFSVVVFVHSRFKHGLCAHLPRDLHVPVSTNAAAFLSNEIHIESVYVYVKLAEVWFSWTSSSFL
jgi:hypothetical protein